MSGCLPASVAWANVGNLYEGARGWRLEPLREGLPLVQDRVVVCPHQWHTPHTVVSVGVRVIWVILSVYVSGEESDDRHAEEHKHHVGNGEHGVHVIGGHVVLDACRVLLVALATRLPLLSGFHPPLVLPIVAHCLGGASSALCCTASSLDIFHRELNLGIVLAPLPLVVEDLVRLLHLVEAVGGTGVVGVLVGVTLLDPLQVPLFYLRRTRRARDAQHIVIGPLPALGRAASRAGGPAAGAAAIAAAAVAPSAARRPATCRLVVLL
mmetsp:Transcript_39769/g.113400  ORF Transcript_39769/g.113400 Transcript_39769/m.113400 type:complete len:267 (-) Transcript_39769:376-1176(-)